MVERIYEGTRMDARVVPVAPLIGSDKDTCRECWGCVRCCPAKAIRVIDRRSEVIIEKCVSCGLCVSECGHAGQAVRDDTPLVRSLLRSGRPVVAVLASEFASALHPMTAPMIERALDSLGFYAVESTVLGEEMVAIAYESYAREGAFPVLRSTCPVVVEWVRRYHPGLTKALAPVVPPYVAQARLIRSLYPPDTAVVYVSPCYARKDEIYDPQLAGAVDVAIDFLELRRMLENVREQAEAGGHRECEARRPGPIKELSLTDGFPRAALLSQSPLSGDVQVVRGLRAVDVLLAGIERGEAAPVLVDMLNCEGCIDGPAVNPGLSVFAKRNLESAERAAQGRSVVSSRTLLRHLPSVDLVRSFEPAVLVMPVPTHDEIDHILTEGGFASRADTIDCGACGYRTCVEHAVAIFQGNSSWEMCFPLQRTRLASRVAQLSEHATLDELTGLWNRRMFGARLVDELARFDRFGIPVSLLMLDVDGLASVNERFECAGGDEVLAQLGAHLRDALRATDLSARYADDTFAVILPGMHKTNAWVVGEKLRESIAALKPMIGGNGAGTPVDIRVSVGIAATSERITDTTGLVEAAEGALVAAKEAGKDQVRLAPDSG
jgi:diguanylate cyclase (GGDEF)-like protein